MSDDASRVARKLLVSWPTQTGNLDPLVLTGYVQEMAERGLTTNEMIGAIEASSSAFLPSVGQLVAHAERRRQGPPPELNRAVAIMSSKITLLDYHDSAKTFDRFVAACADEHEAVARFAVEMGPQGVRSMPDPNHPQQVAGPLQAATFAYKSVREGWEVDPTPGLALKEARTLTLKAGGGEGGLLEKPDFAGFIEGPAEETDQEQ